jgi:hypothetical protein
MKSLFVFNDIYAVIAKNKNEAKNKLVGKLKNGHEWYLKEDAEDPTEQGHLNVKEIPIKEDVAVLF